MRPARRTSRDTLHRAARARHLGPGVALILTSVVLGGTLAALPRSSQAQSAADKLGWHDYILHCSGCHNMDGSGHPAIAIPDFRDQVGYFLRLPEGRAFLLQVPGLTNTELSDERRAGVTNILLKRFAGGSLPPDFAPYTAAEAKRYLETRPADIAAKRYQLYLELNALGYPLR